MNAPAPFLMALQIIVIAACLIIEMHPRIRTGPLASAVGIAIIILTVIHLGEPAPLVIYLANATLLIGLWRFARQRWQPTADPARPYSHWHITP
jgi:hypothetical protein